MYSKTRDASLWLKPKNIKKNIINFLSFFSFSIVFNFFFFQLETYGSWFFIALVARNYCFTIRKNVEWLLAAKRSGRLISRNLTWLPFFPKVPRGLNRLNLIKKDSNSSVFSCLADFARPSAGIKKSPKASAAAFFFIYFEF